MDKTEKLLEFQFPARAENLCVLREKLRAALQHTQRSPNTINCLVLAVSEACMNIMQHAYRNQAPGDIIVEIEQNGDNLLFRLTDFAQHKTRREELQAKPLEEFGPGGLGCHLINVIMDEVKLLDCPEDCGNVLQLKKKLPD